jgi:hypothetical protein
MFLCVSLTDGRYLADVGYGRLTLAQRCARSEGGNQLGNSPIEQPILCLARCRRMSDDARTQADIRAALEQRNTRVAVLIVESILLGFDLLDEQPPAVIQALIDHVKDSLKREGVRAKRRELWEACLTYADEALANAKQKERTLLHGITGE